jgi:hypothetical protein
MLHLDELFASASEIGFSIQTFAGFEIVYDEMKRANSVDRMAQFPVGTVEEFNSTIDMLLDHNFSEERARWVAGWLVKAHQFTTAPQRRALFPNGIPGD